MAINIVLYRLDGGGKRHPLASFDPKDKMLVAKVSARAAQEYTECNQRGQPHSEMKIMKETRIADGDGKLTKEEFVELDSQMEPQGKATNDLNSFFKEGK